MNELEYLDSPPVLTRIQAQSLKIGMHHVTKLATGKYEVAIIRGVHSTPGGSINIDLGPEGHANRNMAPTAEAEIAIVVVGEVILLACPKCQHNGDGVVSELHPGTTLFVCEECGFRGPGAMPPRSEKEKRRVLAAIARAWNNVQR